jgi:hypothetical protein
METIKFVIEDYIDKKAGFRFPVINIYIYDRNLIDLVWEIEHKRRIPKRRKSPRWAYIGFEATNFSRFRAEMLGKKTYRKNVLLTCTCTYAECDCIMAEITIAADVVTWSEIRNPWLGGPTPSPWMNPDEAQEVGWKAVNYSDLGPFVFDREQYLAALSQVTQEYEANKDRFFPPASSSSQGTSEYGLLGGVILGE